MVAVFMLGVGLVMSYSRGAWLATSIGLLYLAWCYGKLKWRYVAIGAGCVAVVVLFHWGSTPDSAPWYVKRADLGRPSAQNRATAWRAGLEIMRDHPLGVGWNNAVKIYGQKYSPPEGGPGALTTNDYLMLGTELGIPALLCLVVYVGLQLGVGSWKSRKPGYPQMAQIHADYCLFPFCESRRNLRKKRLSLELRPPVVQGLWCLWWRFGLTAACSNCPRRRCSGCCWSWGPTGEKRRA